MKITFLFLGLLFIMKIRDKLSHSPDGPAAAQHRRKMVLGVLAFAGQVTLVEQEGRHEAAMFRFLCPYTGAGGKNLLPLGVGAGVRTLYCCDRFYEDEIEERRQRVTRRDPYQSSRDRAKENLQFYYLELDQDTRHSQSLLTPGGHQRLMDLVRRHNVQLLVIDDVEVWTPQVGKKTGEHSPVSLSGLLEELTARGISVLIFTSGAKGRRAVPTLLGSLPHKKLSIKEDKRHPMPGGVRLVISREASHDTSPVPRNFVWWSKIDTDENFDFSCREGDFVEQKSPSKKAIEDHREAIKAMIGEGVPTQKEIADRLRVHPSTICHHIDYLVQHGEVLMDRQKKKLSLPNPDASKAKGTDDNASG